MTLTGQFMSLFPLIDGERIERVTVAANPASPRRSASVTKSGKERRLDELDDYIDPRRAHGKRCERRALNSQSEN